MSMVMLAGLMGMIALAAREAWIDSGRPSPFFWGHVPSARPKVDFWTRRPSKRELRDVALSVGKEG